MNNRFLIRVFFFCASQKKCHRFCLHNFCIVSTRVSIVNFLILIQYLLQRFTHTHGTGSSNNTNTTYFIGKEKKVNYVLFIVQFFCFFKMVNLLLYKFFFSFKICITITKIKRFWIEEEGSKERQDFQLHACSLLQKTADDIFC